MTEHRPEGPKPAEEASGPVLKPADRTRRLLGNTAFVAVAQASGILVSLLLTPYVLHTLGLEQFGLWAFLGSMVAFVGLLQLGLGRGSIRFIAFYSERGELDVVRRLVSYGVLWHFVIGVVLTPLAWLIGRALLPLLDISGNLLDTAETLFPLVFAYAMFTGAMRPLGSLLVGLERMWLTSLTMLASQVIYAGLVVVLLSQGAGLYGLLVAAMAQTVFQATVHYILGVRLIGSVFGNPFALDRAVVRELLKFGGWLQITNLSAFVNDRADALIIGAWVNVTAVGSYAIGQRVAQLTRMLPLTLLPPLFPAVSAIHASGDERQLARTILQASRLVGLLTLTVGGFVIAAAPLIMTVWLGRTYPDVVWITVALVFAYMVNNLTGVGTTTVAAIGKPRYEAEYGVLGMTLNIGATLALAPFFGLYGIVGGSVFAIAVCSSYFLWRFHRLMRLSWWDYLGRWLTKVVVSTAVAAVVVYALREAAPASIQDSRGQGAVVLLILGLVYLLALLTGLRVVRFFEARDLTIVRRVLPRRLQPLARLQAVEFLFGART